ncbi:MAG: hypothetical protein IPK04_04030 [Bdellovibrionales bacterium]|nr:hypothetical protein [Bdellovibrionales bacterium]
MKLNLSLSTTNIWGLPSAMSSSLFLSDPSLPSTQTSIDIVACRYANALTFVLNHLPNVNVISLQIGNEIDYLPEAQNTKFWMNYWRFYASAAAFARTIRTSGISSSLSVGVTASLAGLTGGRGETIRAGLDALNQTISDFVACNYYPLEAGGSQARVDEIKNKVGHVITVAKLKPIHIQEYGCQSGTVAGSSSVLQTTCCKELFKVWDANPTKVTRLFLEFVGVRV